MRDTYVSQCWLGVFILSLALRFECPALWAEDWPEFRGPNGQGIYPSKDLPLVWSKEEGVKWRTELPGNGWSSPIVLGSTIYLTAAVPATEKPNVEKPDLDLMLMLIDVDSGKLLKSVKIFTQSGTEAPGIHSKNSHASPTPIFDDGRIYLHFGHQGTACTDLQGNIIWSNKDLGYPPVHGNGGSPVVVGKLLVFSRDGADISEVTALDKMTGKVIWKRERDIKADKRFSFCTPLVIEAGGKKQLILPGSNVVQSLVPETGEEIWRVSYDGYSVIPRPIYADGLVFICTGYNKPSLLAIDPTGTGDVTSTHLKWKSDTNIPHTPSLVALKGQVLMVSDNGIASSLNASTGKEIWKERIGGNFSASPLLVGDRMYLFSEQGDTTILQIGQTPNELAKNELAKNKLAERCLASPAIVGNDLLIRTANAIYRITKTN